MADKINKCILIVSADKDTNISIESALTRFNYDSVVACDYQDSIDILNHGLKPDLILFDWDDEDIDGAKAITNINHAMVDFSCPIIIISASTEKDSVIKAVKAGAVDYIVKPFHLGRLILKVNSALSSTAPEPDSNRPELRLDAFAELLVLDLSETGCAVQSSFPLKPDAMLMLESEEISTKLNMDSNECFPLRVANCTQQGRKYKVGGQFVGLSPTIRSGLKEACNSPKKLKGK